VRIRGGRFAAFLYHIKCFWPRRPQHLVRTITGLGRCGDSTSPTQGPPKTQRGKHRENCTVACDQASEKRRQSKRRSFGGRHATCGATLKPCVLRQSSVSPPMRYSISSPTRALLRAKETGTSTPLARRRHLCSLPPKLQIAKMFRPIDQMRKVMG